jgi:uncharacterized protein YceH (UPF0502 family)
VTTPLTDVEARVLGALIEKEITTPDYYPLSLNALLNAANQKSNREPVMNLDEDTVRQALRSLDDKGLAKTADNWDSRVSKYEHRLQEALNLTRPETALLCVLLLRGPQTPGELRGRSERLHRFEDLSDVQSGLQRLMKREPPLAKMLSRRPGTKEERFVELLSEERGEPETESAPVQRAVGADAGNGQDRVARLEEQVANLQKEVADLREELLNFRKQFES